MVAPFVCFPHAIEGHQLLHHYRCRCCWLCWLWRHYQVVCKEKGYANGKLFVCLLYGCRLTRWRLPVSCPIRKISCKQQLYLEVWFVIIIISLCLFPLQLKDSLYCFLWTWFPHVSGMLHSPFWRESMAKKVILFNMYRGFSNELNANNCFINAVLQVILFPCTQH